MHILVVLAAFALAVVTPYLGTSSRADVAQMMDDLSAFEQAADEADEDERSG